MALSIREKAVISDMKAIVPLKIGFGEYFGHCEASENASRSIIHLVQYSVIASSSCGWKTLIKKSSRNEVRVLMAMLELTGTISLRRWRKDNVGGSKRLTLNTLGSTTSLCPAAALSDPA